MYRYLYIDIPVARFMHPISSSDTVHIIITDPCNLYTYHIHMIHAMFPILAKNYSCSLIYRLRALFLLNMQNHILHTDIHVYT